MSGDEGREARRSPDRNGPSDPRAVQLLQRHIAGGPQVKIICDGSVQIAGPVRDGLECAWAELGKSLLRCRY